ncbi:MAG: restriction endonuclease subunit S [Alteromonadaceae bacterium]|nr:restriction endonuclease subunit S [Alteromonadaceae bacterium]
MEWLGDVPAHWEIFRLKQLVKVQGGATPTKERLDFWDGQIPWVSPKDMKKDRVSDSADHITKKALSEAGLSMVSPGVVLVVVRGMILAHSIPVAITEVPLTINQDMKALTPCGQLSSEYMLLLLAGIKDAIFSYIDSSAHGTKKLEWERFENIQLPLPTLTEQRLICHKVNEEVEELHQLTSAAISAMKLLQERRSALISAAVTGKIDVRGWQPPAGSSATSERTQTELV